MSKIICEISTRTPDFTSEPIITVSLLNLGDLRLLGFPHMDNCSSREADKTENATRASKNLPVQVRTITRFHQSSCPGSSDSAPEVGQSKSYAHARSNLLQIQYKIC
jgi:predicted nucleic acid binding AN1-type Zn finger protein